MFIKQTEKFQVLA